MLACKWIFHSARSSNVKIRYRMVVRRSSGDSRVNLFGVAFILKMEGA